MPPAIADLLPDFAPRPRPVKQGVPPAGLSAPAAPVAAAEPEVDVDALIAAAVRKAETELRLRIETLYEDQAAEERARHEEELASVRNAITVELGGKLAQALRDLERKAIETATGATARILAPLVDAKVRARAVEALAHSVREALGDGEAIRVRVSGPQSLFMPFTAAMGDHARLLEFNETDSCDLAVAIDATIFETRIADWSSSLTGATH